MSLRAPFPGEPGYQDWKDVADAVDAAGVLGGATHSHSEYADGFDDGVKQALASILGKRKTIYRAGNELRIIFGSFADADVAMTAAVELCSTHGVQNTRGGEHG